MQLKYLMLSTFIYKATAGCASSKIRTPVTTTQSLENTNQVRIERIKYVLNQNTSQILCYINNYPNPEIKDINEETYGILQSYIMNSTITSTFSNNTQNISKDEFSNLIEQILSKNKIIYICGGNKQNQNKFLRDFLKIKFQSYLNIKVYFTKSYLEDKSSNKFQFLLTADYNNQENYILLNGAFYKLRIIIILTELINNYAEETTFFQLTEEEMLEVEANYIKNSNENNDEQLDYSKQHLPLDSISLKSIFQTRLKLLLIDYLIENIDNIKKQKYLKDYINDLNNIPAIIKNYKEYIKTSKKDIENKDILLTFIEKKSFTSKLINDHFLNNPNVPQLKKINKYKEYLEEEIKAEMNDNIQSHFKFLEKIQKALDQVETIDQLKKIINQFVESIPNRYLLYRAKQIDFLFDKVFFNQNDYLVE